VKRYFFLVVFLCTLFSCKHKKKQETFIAPKPVQAVEIAVNADSLMYMIDSNTIYIQGDTLHIESPFIYSFAGIIDNKKIQLHLSNAAGTEYNGYNKSAVIYIDGATDFSYAWFEENPKTKEWTADVTDYDFNTDKQTHICILKLFNPAQENMYIECIYKNKSYKIYPSKEFPSYKCYDQIDNIIFDCRNMQDSSGYNNDFTANRDYSFLAEIISNDQHYEKLQSELKYLFSDSASIESYKTWKHHFHVEKPVDEESFYNYETLSETTPVYIDSFVYVVSDFSYSYMGGAHGMFTTFYGNYDVSTGKLIELKDILDIENNDFIQLYENVLKDTYKDGMLSDDTKMSDKFFILPTGIMFSYAPYELLGFAAGEPHLFFDYEELRPYIYKNSILHKYYK